ncbi:hypothetical protein KMW28_23770 [Flammeovirga yaeyamensis]|uniref:Yip1 domain-containing protein n=1 Tax=Flammeovirga yaeyamensis TaxID=367791 RepID=A0AAX1ND96_9BACT|nr:hypothetical protein [Flammeovirga yaeyamensis]MBB3696606.1 hypothetical protein [Flammeovirga yaeyamensis]NMF33281.1 hypothetical protein [Flammeovirga yaeyamensis]QWG05440.1 hypothetical protein KMW28_23770 [Flammeovirga yaeyamensis]
MANISSWNFTKISFYFLGIMTIIQILLALILIVEIFNTLEQAGDISPTIIGGATQIFFSIFSIPVIINLIFSLIGVYQKNNKRILNLICSFLYPILITIPFSLLVSFAPLLLKM